MRKIGISLIAVLIALFSCASAPQGLDDLDIAIRDASDYLNDNIPRASKIVILNIQSDSSALSDYIIDELIANAVNDRNFTVVDRAQLDLIRAEQNFQWSGEVDDRQALEIGRFFGAQFIVSGRISELGDRYRMIIRALNVQTAQVQGQYNRNMASGKTIVALMKGRSSASSSGGTANVTAPAANSRQTPQAAAQPAGPKAGTYIFFPRPRATMNAIPINVYLDKIVVRGRNMLIYVSNTARGPSDGSPQGFNTAAGFDCLITNLDRPSQSWKQIGTQYVHGQGVIVSYENVTATRFSIENKYWNGVVFWEEIIFDNAEYEP